jgi:uncharacterized protein YbjT (DUF2867 family)
MAGLPSRRVAWLAGATGLIGRALLPRLLEAGAYAEVHLLVRRPVTGMHSHARLFVHEVDLGALPAQLPSADDVYIALGTTIKVAGSEAAFRRVDHDYVVNVARAGREHGATRLAVVSALGADERSRVFYNRVKGEMQRSIAALGYPCVTIAQPSLLIGDRARLGQPERPGEVWAERLLRPVMRLVPRGVRPIRADDVAAALVAATLRGTPGLAILGSGAMQGAAAA